MRLVNRLAPIPFESMPGLLERLRRANYYEESYWYRELLPQPLPENLNLLRPAAHYRVLAALTGLSAKALAALTLHRFVPSFYPNWSLPNLAREHGDLNVPMWEWRELGLYVHGIRTHKVCPHCYRDHQTLLLPWQLRHITSCLIHQVLLVDSCSACGETLRVNLAAGACAHCGQDISTFPTISVAGHSASLQLSALLWNAIGCGSEPFPSPSLPIAADHPLQGMAPSTLFTFLWRGAELLLTRDPHNPIFSPSALPEDISWAAPPKVLRLADVRATHGVLMAMWRLLRHWPDAWHVTLDRIVTDESGDQGRFPAVLREAFIGDAWDWLHQSWAAYMQQRVGTTDVVYPWLRYYRIAQQSPNGQLPELLSQREAARLLGMHERSLKPHIEAGTLRTTQQPLRDHQRQWRLIEAASVMQLRLARESQLPLAGAAAYLGVSEEQIVALVAAGLLEAISGPLINGMPTWTFAPEAPRRSLTALLGQLPVRPIPVFTVDDVWFFPKVQRVLTAVSVRLPRLLLLIQQGTLPTYRAQDGVGLDLLWWERLTVLKTLGQLRRSGGTVHLSVNAVCKRLGCKLTTLRRLYAAGLLVPAQDDTTSGDVRWQYDERDVDTFLEKYITSDTAAEVLGVNCLTVQRWARSGHLMALIGPDVDGSHAYRFDKATLIQWRYERLTFGETMELLGVSKATLDRWVRQERIKALEDMGGKQRWFSRKEVMQLCLLHDDEEPRSD